MHRIKFIAWGFEFVCITTIAIILQKGYSEYWIILPAVVILVIKLIEYKLDLKAEHLMIRSQLLLLINLLSEENLVDSKSIRCTYHVPIFSIFGKKYFQTFDYLPAGTGGGRTLSRKKGITGITFNEKTYFVENFKNDDEYHKQMLEKYNFSMDEIQKKETRRKSYFTYPITDEENLKVLGVIYFDSSIVNTFTSDFESPTMKKIKSACDTIDDNNF